jgi:hypothetical protein
MFDSFSRVLVKGETADAYATATGSEEMSLADIGQGQPFREGLGGMSIA